MEFKIKDIPTKYLVILGVIAFLLISGLAGSLWENRGLKKDIKERDDKIEELDKSKEPVLKDIQADADAIKRKDSIILVLSKRSQILQNTIKNLRYENYRIKNSYVNSSLDERIRVFARLATEKDSTQ